MQGNAIKLDRCSVSSICMYHVMERGVRRLSIFQDEFDHLMFEEILKKEFDSDLLKVSAS